MRYISTRGQAPVRDFAGVLLAGLAEDGGLYRAGNLAAFRAADWRAMRGLPYAELAARVMQPFVGTAIPFATLATICASEAYAGFDHPAVVPLVQLETGLFVQELFHGPTLAFKDMAMQLLGRLFEHVLAEREPGSRSSAPPPATPARRPSRPVADRDRIDIVILHPHGRTSEVQRRQMTTVLAPNVGNIAVEGTFDDCQDLVKAMFADAPFRQELHLSAMNSINWARIAAQMPYYVAAALALGAPDREVAFSVPTGNFGNVLAAWAARRMGLPVARLIVGVQPQRHPGPLPRRQRHVDRAGGASLSPSMDIQVSSNFERLLFELLDRDAVATAATMAEFPPTGRMAVPDAAWHRARRVFHGFRLDDAGTVAEIRRLQAVTGYLADPHTAIGIAAAARPSERTRRAHNRGGHRPSGEIPRCDRAGHRHPPPSATAPRRPI